MCRDRIPEALRKAPDRWDQEELPEEEAETESFLPRLELRSAPPPTPHPTHTRITAERLAGNIVS